MPISFTMRHETCAVHSFVEVWAEQLIRLSGVAPAVAGPALRYLQVRALAQPASLCILVCQAGLLAQKDSRTPVATVALAGLVNVVGDIFLMTVCLNRVLNSQRYSVVRLFRDSKCVAMIEFLRCH